MLAEMAAKADINFTIDAEEADRLVLSLKLLDRLAREPSLGAWRGLGLAVQAYQTRAVEVIAMLAALAKDSGRRLMVRLVKGAYWDSEIKRAQVGGRAGYPVFTTKPATDLSYLAAARALIDAHPYLYAQFATHNAHTLAAVRAMAGRHARSNISACMAWARRFMPPRPTSSGRSRFAPMHLWGRMRTFCPIWCGDCWRMAPIPASCICCWTTTRRRRRSRPIPSREWRRSPARIPAFRCPAICMATG